MHSNMPRSLATALCIATAFQLLSVNVNATAVKSHTKGKHSENAASNSGQVVEGTVETPTSGQSELNGMEDEDAYLEYVADKIMSFCERNAKTSSQVSKTLVFSSLSKEIYCTLNDFWQNTSFKLALFGF